LGGFDRGIPFSGAVGRNKSILHNELGNGRSRPWFPPFARWGEPLGAGGQPVRHTDIGHRIFQPLPGEGDRMARCGAISKGISAIGPGFAGVAATLPSGVSDTYCDNFPAAVTHRWDKPAS
jgi:hypothetical protein